MNRQILGVRVLSMIMVIVDLGLCISWLTNHISSLQTLLWHMGAVLVLGIVAWLFNSRSPTRVVGSLLTCLLLGPIGGFVLVISDLGHIVRSPAMTGLNSVKRVESRTDRVHAQIVQDRRRRSVAHAPPVFSEVFRTGSLAQQQDAIAAISRGYRAEMQPALHTALASDIPAIRVQAAAVYAKLRGELGERAKVLIGLTSQTRLSQELAEEAQNIARSGFVDSETADVLRAHSVRGAGASGQTAGTLLKGRGRKRDAISRPPRIKRYSCGGVA